MEETKTLKELKRLRWRAFLSLNWDEVTRLDAVIEKRQAELRKSPLHTKHGRKENTRSINEEGHLEK